MSTTTAAIMSTELPAAVNARRLLVIRSIALPGVALWLAVAGPRYGVQVSFLHMVVIAGGLLLMNAVLWRQSAAGRWLGNRSLFWQLVIDQLALTALLVSAGGPANPLVLFFMLPLTIAAAILPQRYAWLIAALSAVCFTLMQFSRYLWPDIATRAEQGATAFHTIGMWVGFIVIAGLTAHFVAAMAETVRERDRDLARVREAALRDEQLLAVATLAAGAAHELSTPLATMAVVTSEIAARYPAEQYPGLAGQLRLLRAQIGRCKDALSVLSASAGAARADHVEQLRLPQFVGRAVDEVRRLRPGSRVRVEVTGEPGPVLALDRRAYQALLNVLNNAVDASPDDVAVACHWQGSGVEIAVADRGAGLGAAGDRRPVPGVSTKPGGLGLGLFLSRAALDQLGGELVTEPNPAGGTTVRLRFASNGLTEVAA